MTTATAIDIKMTKNTFEYGASKYFRGNAQNVRLCSFGEKKDPIGPKGYIDVQNSVDPAIVAKRVKYNSMLEIDWSKASKADVEAGGELKVFGLNSNTAASTGYEKVKSAKVVLAGLALDEGPLKDMLNNDAGSARKYLAEEGHDGRIVSEIIIALENDLAEHVSTSASISFAAEGSSGLKVTAKGGKYNTQTFTISPGTTFAYKLCKVKDWNKDKTVINNLETDWKGEG
jgi:hypothetical protein